MTETTHSSHAALDLSLPSYVPPPLLGNGHVQSIVPNLFRWVSLPPYARERIELSDGDVLDVDWLCAGNDRAAILSHGLGGHSRRPYVTGMARALRAAGWDIAAWNFRGCGGTINARPRFTHSGSSDDLDAVVEHVRRRGTYRHIALVGFSMGANITLLYLGRLANAAPPELCGAVAFSVPCDLRAASEVLARPGNRIYMRRFLRQLREHLRAMSARFPESISLRGYEDIRDFRGFDDRYTAPLHGFRDALDYWEQSSSRRVLAAIARPTWIINARNDPFLARECFPDAEAAANPCLHLLAPSSGGHCGFLRFHPQGLYWSEQVAKKVLQTTSETKKPEEMDRK